MLPDESIVKSLTNDFTPVMWKYDGLGGKVIQWTKAHGNTNDDPAHKVWILDAEGQEVARAAREAESASSMKTWLADGLESFKKAKLPGIAQLFVAPPEGADPAEPGVTPRIVWYAASDAEGASPERKAAAARTNALTEKVLTSRKLESLTKGAELWRVDATTAPDATPLSADENRKLPRLVLLGPRPPLGKTAVRIELAGASLTLDAFTAALEKLPKPPAK